MHGPSVSRGLIKNRGRLGNAGLIPDVYKPPTSGPSDKPFRKILNLLG